MSVQSSLSALYREQEVEKGVFVERRGAAIAGARPFSEPPSFHIQQRKGLNAHLGSCEACSVTKYRGRWKDISNPF